MPIISIAFLGRRVNEAERSIWIFHVKRGLRDEKAKEYGGNPSAAIVDMDTIVLPLYACAAGVFVLGYVFLNDEFFAVRLIEGNGFLVVRDGDIRNPI